MQVLAICIAVVDSVAITVLLPQVAAEFQSPQSTAIWVVNLYQIAVLGLLLPLASLGQRIGFRRIYLGGLLVLGAGAVLSASAPSLAVLALGRVIQGIGGAGVMAVNTALLRESIPASALARALATFSTATALSMTLAPTLAALALSLGSWRWLYALLAPLTLAAAWVAARLLPAARPVPASPFHLPAALLNLLVVALFLLAARLMPSGVALALLAASVVLGVLYLRLQTTRLHPLFPVDLLRRPLFALSLGSSVLAFTAQMLGMVSLPFLLSGQFADPVRVGTVMSAWPAGILASTVAIRFVIGRVPSGLLGGLGMALVSLGLLLLALNAGSESVSGWAWRTALCGLGFGLFQSPNNHTILSSAPADRSGSASGMLGTARLTGQALGAVGTALIFSAFVPAEQSSRGVWVCLCCGAALAAVAALCSSMRLAAPAAGTDA